jgi:hypothetical protein
MTDSWAQSIGAQRRPTGKRGYDVLASQIESHVLAPAILIALLDKTGCAFTTNSLRLFRMQGPAAERAGRHPVPALESL